MKRLSLALLLGIALCIGGQSLFAADNNGKKEKKEKQEQRVRDILESGSFTIDVDRALPLSGRSVNLTSSYSLELRGDSAISHLPYFGRAYSVPYGGGDGMRFEEAITDYSISYSKKDVAQIKFNARTEEDKFSFHVQVFPNGSASINVTPVNRQSISYQGELNTREKDE